MIIEKKDIDSLKQNDRIELYSRLSYLNILKPESSTLVFLGWLGFYILNYVVFGISSIMFMQLGDFSSAMLMLILRKIGGVMIIVALILCLIKCYKDYKKFINKHNETIEEYFNIKPKGIKK